MPDGTFCERGKGKEEGGGRKTGKVASPCPLGFFELLLARPSPLTSSLLAHPLISHMHKAVNRAPMDDRRVAFFLLHGNPPNFTQEH